MCVEVTDAIGRGELFEELSMHFRVAVVQGMVRQTMGMSLAPGCGDGAFGLSLFFEVEMCCLGRQ